MADEGNALGRVNPGDPMKFPARTFNIFCDTAEEVARMRTLNAAGAPRGRTINTGVVTVRNDSGADRARFDVLGVGDPIIDNSDNLAEFQNRVTFKGLLPDIDLHCGRFVILLEPLADGKIGKAVVSGVCQAKINVGDEAHEFADIIDEDATALVSGESGVEILWKETGTGAAKWAIVRLGPRTSLRIARVILLDDWHACGIATAHVMDWSSVPNEAGDLAENTESTVTCRDPAGCIEWNLAAMQDEAGSWYIPAGWYCTVWQPEDATDGHWELLHVGKNCEEGSGSEGSEESGSEESGSEESGSEESGSGECVTPEQAGLGGLTGYNAGNRQALCHDDQGCLFWLDIGPCVEGSGSEA